MNAFFELLHGELSAFGVFMVDVVVFIAVAVIVYALAFLTKYKAADVVIRLREWVRLRRRGGLVHSKRETL